ncbi:MAG: DUF3347 domain-containing protein [Bacteroidota bacterium]
MNLRLVISGLVIASMFGACNQTSDTKETAAVDSAAVGSAPAADLKDEKSQQVYNEYLKLKDVLVASDASGAQQASKELAAALSQIDGCENTSSLANKIAAASDLKTQRMHFTALSSDIVALMKHTDVNSGAMYVQHCPMANEGAGGYWLAAEKEVRNPYYGDEMLNCGSVEETIGTGKN